MNNAPVAWQLLSLWKEDRAEPISIKVSDSMEARVGETFRKRLIVFYIPLLLFLGALMAGALFGSVPVAFVCSFFVEHYVSGVTGAVKG